MIIKLDEHIEYQKDTVVSKEILKSKNGSITLFAFAEGEGLSEHKAPFDAFVQCLDGKVDIILDGESNILNKGDIIIMPANIPHAVKAISDFKMLLTMIKE